MSIAKSPSDKRLLSAVTAAQRPIGYPELCEATGLTRKNARSSASRLRAYGQIHIVQWLPSTNGGAPSPLFAAGVGDEPAAPAQIATALASRIARQHAARIARINAGEPVAQAILMGRSWLAALLT